MTGTVKHWAAHDIKQWDGLEPIIVMFHGYGSHEHDLTGLVKYLPGELPWVSLRGPVNVEHGGHAWFPLATPGNPNPDEVAKATEMVWQWIDEHIPAGAPIIALGFSQGGLMATQLLRTRPSKIAGTIILAGFTLAADQPADSELAKSKPAVIYCRGLQDQMISGETVARTEAWLDEHTSAKIYRYENLGHSIDERVLADVSDYLRGLL